MNQTFGHALYNVLGAHNGRLTTDGNLRTGVSNPDSPLDLDPTNLVAELASLDARYLGAAPTVVGPAERGFGRGESTPMPLAADLVTHPSNPLQIDPAAMQAILADIAKFNQGAAYYDLNCMTTPDGKLAVEAVVALHQQLFPAVAPPAPAPGQGHAPGPVAGASVLRLLGGRFVVSATYGAAAASATAMPGARDRDGDFSFESPLDRELGLRVTPGLAGRIWIFIAGWTDRPCTVVVHDTKTDTEKTYSSQGGKPFVTVLDTDGFAA